MKWLRDWLTTDGPGYSGYPEIDIQAHRSNARLTRLLGILCFGAALGYGLLMNSLAAIWFGIAIAGWTNWAAAGLEKQALEWELELKQEE